MNKHEDIKDLSSHVLRIANWEETQRYKQGNKNFSNDQPWFKFNARKLLANREFMSLSIEHREFLVMLWALASSDNGYLPDPDQIAFILRREIILTKEYLGYFTENKWIISVPRAMYMTDNGVDYSSQMNRQHETSTDY